VTFRVLPVAVGDSRAARSRAAGRGGACRDHSVFAGTTAAFPCCMMSKILALLLLSASFAYADRAPPGELQLALSRQRDAATRERINAQLTTIAERDIVTAQIVRDTAQRQRAVAERVHRSDDAERWSQRLAGAQHDEREAQDRAARYARERDNAHADFQASAERVRRLERRASRSHAT
jgi:hypothetical protein